MIRGAHTRPENIVPKEVRDTVAFDVLLVFITLEMMPVMMLPEFPQITVGRRVSMMQIKMHHIITHVSRQSAAKQAIREI